jgi:hypothetical protein
VLGVVFVLLSLLFVLESSTSISRKTGYNIGNSSAGFMFQSSISLLSRVFVFMLMPLIGYLADQNNFFESEYEVLNYYLFMIVFLFLLYIFRLKVEKIYATFLLRVEENGSFFKPLKHKNLLDIKFCKLPKFKRFKFFKKLNIVFLIAYIPYYLAWPVVMILLQEFNENRAMILGMSSIFNGINTIIITMFIDPKLTQMGKCSRVIQHVYDDLVLLRVYSVISGYFILALIVTLYS